MGLAPPKEQEPYQESWIRHWFHIGCASRRSYWLQYPGHTDGNKGYFSPCHATRLAQTQFVGGTLWPSPDDKDQTNHTHSHTIVSPSGSIKVLLLNKKSQSTSLMQEVEKFNKPPKGNLSYNKDTNSFLWQFP